MQLLTYIAGFTQCTPEETQQKTIATLVGLIVALAMLLVTTLLFVCVKKSKHKRVVKILVGLLVALIGIILSLGAGFWVILFIAPWCT